MTQKDKKIEHFLANPNNFKYQQIKIILINLGFNEIQAKGSHVKFKHTLITHDLIIPIHSNDCKTYYKKQIVKIIKKYKLNY
ncbi:type II toxin-antitoxin system HicA family toxin [Candidatus Parcubacteria bacterium]|nr:type II toxin-antitoxin system HicA family toxin [Candidatus Parcubacteria bacterium]